MTTNYLFQKDKVEEARNNCQAIVEQANKTGWTEKLENAFIVAQTFEIFISKKYLTTAPKAPTC